MIRYDEKFNREIKNIVNKYNSKVNRMSKSLRNDIYVPEKLDKQTLNALKKSSKNRTELRRQLRLYENYSKRGGETFSRLGKTSIPKFEKNRFRINLTTAKKKLSEKQRFYEETKIKVLGKEEIQTHKEYRDPRYISIKRNLEKLQNINIKTNEGYLEAVDYVNRIIDDERMQRVNFEKYINGLETLDVNFLGSNLIEGTNIEKTDYIKYKLLELSPEQFEYLYDTDIGVRGITTYFGILSPKKLEALRKKGIDIKTYIESIDIDGANEYINELYKNIDKLVNDTKKI